MRGDTCRSLAVYEGWTSEPTKELTTVPWQQTSIQSNVQWAAIRLSESLFRFLSSLALPTWPPPRAGICTLFFTFSFSRSFSYQRDFFTILPVHPLQGRIPSLCTSHAYKPVLLFVEKGIALNRKPPLLRALVYSQSSTPWYCFCLSETLFLRLWPLAFIFGQGTTVTHDCHDWNGTA